jgi:hypothetical protein
VENADSLLAGGAGTRLEWSQIPEVVRASIVGRLGAPVVAAVSQERGFSPALAARLRLADGRRAFVKAIGPDEESGAPGGQAAYRREAAIAAQLPPTAPAPRLQASWDEHGWIVLILEDIEGTNPAHPWRGDELRRVLEALTVLAETLTPAPLSAPRAAAPGRRPHWAQIAMTPKLVDQVTDLDPWLRPNLEILARAEERFENAAAGETLIHSDIRSDNILLTEQRVLFVDWPHAMVGAPWLDLLYLLPSVAMQGGPEPDAVFWSHPLSRHADRDAVIAVLAGVAGYLLHGATQAPPPGLPTLRRFQLAQGQEALRWLRQLID